MEFNSIKDSPSIGTKANHLLNGYNIEPVEAVSGGGFIINYSLEHNALFDRYLPNDTYDIIRIAPTGKAHMKDVFEAVNHLSLKYKTIRSFACRIKKLTYSF